MSSFQLDWQFWYVLNGLILFDLDQNSIFSCVYVESYVYTKFYTVVSRTV